MNANLLFYVCTSVAIFCWLFLIFSPRFLFTQFLMRSHLLTLILAGIYLLLIILYGRKVTGNFYSLEGVLTLFQDPYILLAGWIHYLAFDFWIGCWEVEKAQKEGISHLLLIPVLILTFLYGPIGLITFFITRFFWRTYKGVR